jgi:hypothetical protein
MFELITELVSLLEHPSSLYACEELIAQQNVNCTIYGSGDQFEPTCSLRSFDQEHNSCEVADLEEIFGLTATLFEYQYRHGEYAESTLKQEFELAKAADIRGYYEEAEYHCRRIVDREPQIVVETFLGMILAKTSRLEESRILLFSALTSFIIQFAFSDHTTNVLRYKHIERLFGELIRRSNEDWQSLTSCMCQMMAMIMNSESKGTMDQIFPQLITHGLSIAHECMALQFFDSANSMYKLLLDYHKYSDEILYGIEIAEAHLEFGLILRMEDEWKESADHLVFACESAFYSGTHERLLLSRLEDSLDDIPPHVASTPYIKFRVERTRNLLALAQRQSSLIQATAEAARLSCMDDYLRSNLPVHFVTPAPSTVLTLAQFTSPRMPAGSVQTDGDCTSTTSNSSKIGLTWSDTIVSGMSDVRYSQFMDLTSA